MQKFFKEMLPVIAAIAAWELFLKQQVTRVTG